MKPAIHHIDVPWRPRFPSTKGGGPIEALWAEVVAAQPQSAFHRRKAVAPLKPDPHVRVHAQPGALSIAERRWPH